MAEDQVPDQKKHAACDECRTRKLKCSGETPNCQRCQTEGLSCVYSLRKKMGRPRKRAREDGDVHPTNDFGQVGDAMSFDFNSVVPEHIVGIPGTGIPLALGSRMPNITTMEAPQNPTAAWLDPLLQDAGANHSGPEFRPLVPYIGSPDRFATSNLAEASSYPTPPHTNTQFSPPPGTCLCLPNMYLTLTDLSGTKDWTFPYSIHKLKLAMQTSDTVLRCPTCPHETTSAMQNLMMLTTILTTVINCYRKLLDGIDAEAAKAEDEGRTLGYRMGDSNPERWHMHTGTDDCPMGINVDLDPGEYKMLAKKVIKADVHGAANHPPNAISILGLVQKLEERQQEWHTGTPSEEVRAYYARAGLECQPGSGDHNCLKLISMIRQHVALLGI